MIGTINCVYETPCHWCSKWNKKCDNKIGCQSSNDLADAQVNWSKLGRDMLDKWNAKE